MNPVHLEAIFWVYNILSMINGFDHIESNIINKCGRLLLNMSARTLSEHWVCFGGGGGDSSSGCSTTPFLHILSEAYAQCVHSTLKPVSSFYRLYLYSHNNGSLSSLYIPQFTAQQLTHFGLHSMAQPLSLSPIIIPRYRLFRCPQFQFIVVLRCSISFALSVLLPISIVIYAVCIFIVIAIVAAAVVAPLLQLLSETDSFISFAPLELNALFFCLMLLYTVTLPKRADAHGILLLMLLF